MTKNKVYITNLAKFLPGSPVSNDEMESVLGQVANKPSRARKTVLRSNKITSRYYAIDKASGEMTHTGAQLAVEAIKLLDDQAFSIQKIQCLATATSIPDQIMPSQAVMIHGELGIPPCEAITTSGICVSGMAAMKYAYMSIASGSHENAVAVAAELASIVMRGENFNSEIEQKIKELESKPELAFEKDFLRWMLSDGAGAVLLQSAPRKKGMSLSINWLEIISYANEVEACMYAGGEKLNHKLKGWMSYSSQERDQQSIMSVKQDVKLLNDKIIYYTVERALSDIRKKHPINAEDIDWFLPHYSSNFFRQKVYDGLANINFEIPFDKWFTNLSDVGNVGSASMYIMLAEIYASGKLKTGQKILCYIPESGRFSSCFMLLTVE
ncbi:3-oxoacyl-[acyl-carrier-protein] synthase III [hydrothermal vent metagenome]|uniref:3-oxoacyl-[acyl-carrier-protein] synthase III n=1 Tax=hydrothermal vent metagenome TaxID=652676 RepID=A0A3B0W0S3_9ZZZZ